MRSELADQLRQVLQAAPQAVQLVNSENIHPALPHLGHYNIQTFSRESRAARFVQIFPNFGFGPAASDIREHFAQLAIVFLPVR